MTQVFPGCEVSVAAFALTKLRCHCGLDRPVVVVGVKDDYAVTGNTS